jgi:hypothetical protein
VESNLESLPSGPSSNPQLEISTLILSFLRDLTAYVQGVPNESGIIQRLRPHNETFRKKIHFTLPRFSPYESSLGIVPSLPDFLTEEDPNQADEAGSIYEDSTDIISIDAVMHLIRG